ncbi:MAG: TonB family protein [Chitinivibrionales bacterium]|nr:TonB family protein [Chitinivibrionales bacterium]
MLNALTKAGAVLVKLAVVLVLNFALFIAIPALSDMFDALSNKDEKNKPQQRIVAEMIRPKKKEEKKKKRRRIRQVKSGEAKGGNRGMKLKFNPDLGVASGEGVAVESQQDLEAEVFEEGETDEDFVVIRQTPIEFPERAKEQGIEGTLEVVFIIGVDGQAKDIEIVRSPHPTITGAARDAIERWKFKPAKNKGVPVKVRVRQVVDFRLD